MAKTKELAHDKLRAQLNPEKIPYADSREIPLEGRLVPPQPRALRALELGFAIKEKGYNVYLSGDINLGRTYFLTSFLSPRAKKAPQPRDVAYVFNFLDPDRPWAISLPAGQGRKLKNKMASAMVRIRRDIAGQLETEAYRKKRQSIVERFQESRESLVKKMETEATSQGFNLDLDEQGGLTLYPLVEGKLLSEEEFERLDGNLKKTLKKRSEKVMAEVSKLMRKVNRAEDRYKDKEYDLDLMIVEKVLAKHLDPLAREMDKKGDNESLARYFKAMKEDMAEHLEKFLPGSPFQDPTLEFPPGGGEDFFVRYQVNAFVDHHAAEGAPVVIEEHPTANNLLGCIEREAEMGALITDFTLIKAGALHRANNGYLVLSVEDVLQHPGAWEGLMRALRSGQAKIEDTDDGHDQIRTKTIEPEPVPLDVKVILIGTDEMHEFIWENDDRFSKLFKIKAQLQDRVDRNTASIRMCLRQLGRIIREAELKPLGKRALAAMVDHCSRLAGDQQKISLQWPRVRELLVEASAFAGLENRDMVTLDILRRTIEAKEYRSNLYEEEFMEEYDRELIKVATSGQAVGRANGLSVTRFGEYDIGLPHQIACTVGVGHGGIIDLEREAELGGPIHTKGMMILKSYLLGLFAQDKPLVVTGSLCFEQSYAHVEGDSASGAELAALLSALSGAPINLSLAFTGAVNQSGEIMAVGGVSRKVEGFFEVCRRRGLTGEQGVLIPHDNTRHLMLKDEVVKAVKNGKFHIYPIKRLEQAMELLTGLPAGRRTKDGFSTGSLYRRVDVRLRELASLAESGGDSDKE